MHRIQDRMGAARATASRLGVLLAMFLTVHPADAQMNQDVMMKWMDAKVVHYSVVGDFDGEDMVVQAGTNGLAPVKDHVEIGFDYDITQAKLVGAAVFKNFPTQMGALRNGADHCRAPTISGSFEHATIESLKDGQGGQLEMVVRTEYPAAQMTVACTGGNQAVAAHVKSDHVDFIVPGIMMLAMGDALTGELTVSKDHKSFILKQRGWTYVYTPSKVR